MVGREERIELCNPKRRKKKKKLSHVVEKQNESSLNTYSNIPSSIMCIDPSGHFEPIQGKWRIGQNNV